MLPKNGIMRRLLRPWKYEEFNKREDRSRILQSDALMIIDMQPAYLQAVSDEYLGEKVAYQQGKIVEAEENGASIYLVEFGYQPTIPQLKFTKGYESFIKAQENAFSWTGLEGMLAPLQPEAVHTMGGWAESCVNSTVLSGIKRGFPMVIHKDGILSNDGKNYWMDIALRNYEMHSIPVV